MPHLSKYAKYSVTPVLLAVVFVLCTYAFHARLSKSPPSAEVIKNNTATNNLPAAKKASYLGIMSLAASKKTHCVATLLAMPSITICAPIAFTTFATACKTLKTSVYGLLAKRQTVTLKTQYACYVPCALPVN